MRPKPDAEGAPPPLSATTLLLMHFDGAGFLVDSSPYNRSFAPYGPGFTQDILAVFGDSAYGNYNSILLSGYEFPDMSSIDHTIECWLYIPTSAEGDPMSITHLPIDRLTTTTGQHFAYDGWGQLSFSDGATNAAVAGYVVPTDTWVHVAAVQQASCKRIFVDGVLQAIATQSAPAGAASCSVGGLHFAGYQYGAGGGFIDELRISARALYCDNFIVPASPFDGSVDAPAAELCGPCCELSGTWLGEGCGTEEDPCAMTLSYADGACGVTVVVIGSCC